VPSNKTRHTLARQWELLKLLPTRSSGRTAKELAEALNESGFSVSKRQVERDLGELYETFNLDCDMDSKPYRWAMPPGKVTLDIPGLTLAEALSLRMVEDTLKNLMPPAVWQALEARFRQAERKLDALTDDNPNAGWTAKVRSAPPSLPFLPPSIKPEVLEAIQEALLANRQIDVEYQAIGEGENRRLRLHPLGLVSRVPTTYLVATAFGYSDVRLYALHRISQVSQLDTQAKRPDKFDLDDYIQSGALQFGSGGTVRLYAEISEYLANILCETPLSERQEIAVQDGKNILTATVADSWQLRWWILSQGAGIVVLEPVELRQKIQAVLQRACSKYEPPV